MNYLIIGEPKGDQTIKLIELGVDPKNIYVWEDSAKGQYCVKMEGATVTDNLDNFDGMKFNIALANPPYLRGIHIDFFIRLLEVSDTVHIIHPSSWLFRSTTAKENQLKDMLKGRIKSIVLFNGHSKFEGAVFGVPLTITTAVKSHEGPISLKYETTGNEYFIDSLDDMPTGFWEPTESNKNLVSKYKELTSDSSIFDLLGDYQKDSISLSTPRVCGHVNLSTPRICGNRSQKGDRFVNDDYFTFFYRNSDIDTVNINNKVYMVKTEFERESLISYMKTKFARFGLSINKISQDAHISRYLTSVPLPPLDRLWTEQSVYDHYKLTSEEIKSIEFFIPNYY